MLNRKGKKFIKFLGPVAKAVVGVLLFYRLGEIVQMSTSSLLLEPPFLS